MAYRGNMFRQIEYNNRKRPDLRQGKGINPCMYHETVIKPFNTVTYKMMLVRLIIIAIDVVSIVMGIISMIGG